MTSSTPREKERGPSAIEAKNAFMPATVATTALWLISTPFGSPVVPEVYMSVQRSEGEGGLAGAGSAWPWDRNSAQGVTVSPAALAASATSSAMSPQTTTAFSDGASPPSMTAAESGASLSEAAKTAEAVECSRMNWTAFSPSES